MPEETTTSAEPQEQEAQASGIVHDDIMQRLLEYQRQLREGVAPAEALPAEEPAAEISTEAGQVVDITEAEAELETAAAEPEATDEAPEIVEIVDVVEIEEPQPPAGEPAEELFSSRVVPTPEPATAEPAPAEPAPAEPAPAEPAPAEPGAPAPAPDATDLAERVVALEETLARVSSLVADLRAGFQDMAIAADERLAAIEETLAGIGSPSQN